MKITITQEIEFEPVILTVSAHVRYWEDATVNGKEDTDGTLIPFRSGDLWIPRIAIKEGRFLNWPQGTTAEIHYKVCDRGEYWIEDLDGTKAKYTGHYVPDELLCHGGEGFGDYIILNVNADGTIKNYCEPELDGEGWEITA